MPNTDTEQSPRFATSASVPARLIATPAGDVPVASVVTTRGGRIVRSMTDRRLSDTSASDSSGATATDDDRPTPLPGSSISSSSRGGSVFMSMMATVLGGAFATTLGTPLSSTTLLSLTDTAICAAAPKLAPSAHSAARRRGTFIRAPWQVSRAPA